MSDLKALIEQKASRRESVLPEPVVRRLLREGAGLTQAELAAVLGVMRPTVSRWESGARDPKGEYRDRYRTALEELSRV